MKVLNGRLYISLILSQSELDEALKDFQGTPRLKYYQDYIYVGLASLGDRNSDGFGVMIYFDKLGTQQWQVQLCKYNLEHAEKLLSKIPYLFNLYQRSKK